jgi:hypothetical protein
LHLGAGILDIGFRFGDGRDGAGVVGFAGLKILLRDDTAREQTVSPVAAILRFFHGRFVRDDAGLGRPELRLSLRKLRADLVRVDDGKHLALGDLVVEIDGDAIKTPGNLRADIHLVFRL